MNKVVLIGPVYPYKGGIAHYTSLLYKALSKKFDVKLISYKKQYPKFLFKKEQRDYSNDLFKIEGTEFLINTYNPLNIFMTGKYIKALQPEMVIIQWWHPYFAPCYWLLEKSIGKKIKKVFICHNVFPHERFPADKLLTRLVIKNGDGFIVHSKSDAKDLLSIKQNANYQYNPHPTYNAFKIRDISKEEARNELGIDSNKKIILFFGFVREYKGLKHLINAISLIAGNIPDVLLMIVGSFGEDKVDYINLIKSYNIEDYVYLKDDYTPDNEVEKYFSACDIVALPYESATQSGIVQIAYGFEKPVIVTNVGGLPDVVTNGKSGYVIPARNEFKLAEAIYDFYRNNRESELVNGVKEEAHKFDWDRIIEKIEFL